MVSILKLHIAWVHKEEEMPEVACATFWILAIPREFW